MNENKTNTTPHFTGRNVPIAELAKALNVSPQTVRIGIQQKVFPFIAFKLDGSSEYSYICTDKAVFDFCGYFRETSRKENADEK